MDTLIQVMVYMIFFLVGRAMLDLWEPRRQYCWWAGVFMGVFTVLAITGGM